MREMLKKMGHVVSAEMRTSPSHLRDSEENFSLEDVMVTAVTISPQHLERYISLVPIWSVSIVRDGERQHTWNL